jgi:putative hemolysin
MGLFVASVLVALLISGLCSLMEAVLLSLRPGQVAEIIAHRPLIGELWRRHKADIERPIAAILILNTAAHTIGASVAGAEFDRLYGNRWLWVFSVVFTFLMLQFTEILPKGVGVRHSRALAYWIARPLDVLVRLMLPIQAVVQFINRPFVSPESKNHAITTPEEIASLAGFARLSGEISGEQESIIRRGMRLSSEKVREVMRPRVDVDAMDVDTPSEEVLGAVAMSGFARMPVYQGDLDNILGFVYIKDLLLELHMGRPLALRRLLRPALVVPETLRLDEMVRRFRQERTQMAVVLDEHGGTEGLVTLEDVLEAIVGTIHDEHRPQGEELVRQDDTHWLANGSFSLDELLETLGRPDLRAFAREEIITVAGLVQSQLDRIAAAGDQITWNGLTLEVLDADGQRIGHVRIHAERGM